MNDPILQLQSTFSSLVQSFKQELMSVRSNRPNVQMVEDVRVEYYGETVPLKSIASLGVQPPRELTCNVYDKSALPNVVKALEAMGAGFSVSAEGALVRIFFPELSLERKQEVVKFVRAMLESRRIEIRRFRDEANKNIEKLMAEGELREDDKFRLRDDVQKEVDKTNQEMERLFEIKEKEILA